MRLLATAPLAGARSLSPWRTLPSLRAISLVEGVRAAFACGVIVVAKAWFDWPPLSVMALAAMLTCFCDVGGPIRPRLVTLSSFTGLAAFAWSVFGLIQPLGPPATIPLACLAIFTLSFARIWGVPAQTVGNLLIVIVCLALDEPLDGAHALVIAGMIVVGGAWATFLVIVVWRLHPYRPARLAVAEIWHRLAAMAGDLRDLAAHPALEAHHWDSHARVHRRAAREAVEAARALVVDIVRSRERISARAAQALLRLEAGEQLLGSLIALSDEIERRIGPQERRPTEALLRHLRPLLTILARAMANDRPIDLRRIERTLDIMHRSVADDPRLARILERIADRVRIAAKLSAPEGYRPGGGLLGDAGQPWRERVLEPVRANLSWRSANLRHALRAAVVAGPALAITAYYGGPYTHWLTITAVLTMQPFYASTWQRALERIGGTVLGGIVGAVIAYYASNPIVIAAFLFPLCIVGFGARQVSFGAFIACLTPLIVVLVEMVVPGHSSWEIAGMRALFTVTGGVIAVASCIVLWPSWEPDRLEVELARSIEAHAAYAEIVIAQRLGEAGEEAADEAARAAGMTTNNLEVSLARALQEPRKTRARLDAVMVADATLRRIAGRLSALRHDPAARIEPQALAPWRRWIGDALRGIAAGTGIPPSPGAPPGEALGRMVRQVELLAGALDRKTEGVTIS